MLSYRPSAKGVECSNSVVILYTSLAVEVNEFFSLSCSSSLLLITCSGGINYNFYSEEMSGVKIQCS